MKKPADKTPKYFINKNKEFVIENYNFSKPFSSFFPGIAGKYGIPMWTFYVNRGQCISSFGTKDKDHAILEFFPANKAWQTVSSLGFRTFIKVSTSKKTILYEPFHNGFSNLDYKITNRMYITSSDLMLEEENLSLGLSIKIRYFNIPNDTYAGLARVVTIRNLNSHLKKISLIDGLPQIVPYGTNNFFLKKMGRTIEAWMNVENLDKNVPFYKLSVDPTDRPEVVHIKGGNFYLSFQNSKDSTSIIKPMVNPENIFGVVTDFSCPREFLKDGFKPLKNETITSKMPCGFSFLESNLTKNKELELCTIIGQMRSIEILNSSIKRIASKVYLNQKYLENKTIINELQSDIETHSGSDEFNLYTKQTYLDNILRGGYPNTFETKNKKTIFYTYSRKHGDPERDYNKFLIQPTYFSQGNGNYRDVNQNRRCDTWFNPDLQAENLINFINLVQIDGYNPLVVKGESFVLLKDTNLEIYLKRLTPDIRLKLTQRLNKPFTPGDIAVFIKDSKIKLSTSTDEFLNFVLNNSLKIQDAEHGEGFWTDHWTYNLDLIENYLKLFPENFKNLFFQIKVFSYFDNTETVKPRSEKYVLYNGLPRQLNAISLDHAKKEMIHKRTSQPHVVRTEYGQGPIYYTTLINKLLCLAANKLSSLDPFGKGIEMEANKPNWYDALNGLPALFGSSLCETFELRRLIVFIKESIKLNNVSKINITQEVLGFINGLKNIMLEDAFSYWDKSSNLKEDFRKNCRLGFSGNEIATETKDLLMFLDLALKKLEQATFKAYDPKQGLYYAYFINEVKKFDRLKDDFIKPTLFEQKNVSLFLESQVHALKVIENIQSARKMYTNVRRSELFDKNLKMYKVTASLKDMPEEIGRCRVFSPGWLENESIWLHMEYKYILELLKAGLYEEFYLDFKNVLIPFLNPYKYGRSILENSSFLVSSAFKDKKLHGNGFVARLSGSTAEFLEIWLIMNAGQKPFFLNESKELNLRFEPALIGWLFDKLGRYSFNFLSRVRINYYNPKRKNTFGKNAAKIRKIIFQDKDSKTVSINSAIIPYPYSQQIRSRQIKQIDIYLE